MERPSPGGAAIVGVLLEERRGVRPWVQGYSLSIAVEGECVIAAGTTDGTVGAPMDQGGYFAGGFRYTEVTTGPGNRGLVHAMVFSFGPVSIDVDSGPYLLLNLHVQRGAAGCESCRVEFRDGLAGSFPPVSNAITYRAAEVIPELSPGMAVECVMAQKPGDGNQDGRLDLSDAVDLLSRLFLVLDPPDLPCGDGSLSQPSNARLLDANGDTRIDISDAVSILSFLFLGGSPHALGSGCVQLLDCHPGPACLE